MSAESQAAHAASGPPDTRPDDAERTASAVQRRYAPPEAIEAQELSPKPLGFIGFALYLAFAGALIAAAFELFPLGGTLSSDTIALGGIVGAYTWGRYSRSRWAGFGIGLLVSFLAIGLAITARHTLGPL